jgi:hypothetical protein
LIDWGLSIDSNITKKYSNNHNKPKENNSSKGLLITTNAGISYNGLKNKIPLK